MPMAEQGKGAAGIVAGMLQEASAHIPSEAEQLDMLVASQRPGSERLHVTSPSGKRQRFDGAGLAAEVERTAKAGRPPGAQNLSTRELRAWVVRLLGGTPQERLARWCMLEPEELARKLGCSVVEAFDRQIAILKELQPYFMARMAPVDDQGKAVPLINVQLGSSQLGGAGGKPWDEAFFTLDGEAVEPEGDAP